MSLGLNHFMMLLIKKLSAVKLHHQACTLRYIKVTGYLELYDFVYVDIHATKTGILKS